MGDRNYYPNQYNPFIAQNYGYNQYQPSPQQQIPQSQPYPGPYFPNVPSQGGGFTVNTNMPVYNTGAIAQNPGTHSAPSLDRDDKPPPSYEESRSDRLLSRSKFSSPAWNYVDDKVEMDQCPPKRSSARDFFDMPGETQSVKKSPDGSGDNYYSSQSFQRESREKFSLSNNSNSSQGYQRKSQERFNSPNNSILGEYSSQGFQRESQDRFNSPNRFSQPSDHAGQSDNRFSQNNQGGYVKNYQNRGRGRGRGGFRGQRNWQNNERPRNHEEHADDRKFDFEEQGQESDDEYGDGNDRNDEYPEKVNAFIPDPTIVSEYTYYPPSLEEMGEMFKDLVIYFFWKTAKNHKEKNPFVVICETFRRSAGYCNIDVEDGYDPTQKDRKFCTLRYCGMMMVRGVGENGCIKEARVWAGVTLINHLAMSCYTLKSRADYYSVQAFEKMKEVGSVPGVYIFVPEQEAYDFDSSRNYIKHNIKEDSDVEYIFHLKNYKQAMQLKAWVRRQKLEFRLIIKDGWYGICRIRTTQYWRDKILASGSMESPRYTLIRPQGIGIEMFNNFNITSVVPKLKKIPQTPVSIANLYGGPGEGPIINRARPPWERNNRAGGKWKKTKTKKIMDQVKMGVPLNSVKAFMFLNKKKKKQMQKRLAKRL